MRHPILPAARVPGYHSRLAFVISLVILFGCAPDREKQFTRLDADDTGITFINWNNETEATNILTYEYLYNGGGVATGDINNDGLTDIYFTSNSHENKLYLNKGGLKFEDISARSGAACEPGWKTGVCMVDINADGWLDIYVSRSAQTNNAMRRNVLLINNGDLTFTERAAAYGLDDDSYSTQAAFFDHDHDGDLDAVLLNHSLLAISNSYDISLRNTTTRFPGVGNKLLKNEGGRYRDISDSAGVYGPASNYGLGLSLSDINNDGWVDMYLGCDYTGRDKLLINKNGSAFLDVTDSVLSHISKFTMGTDIADINGDGWMDICTLDMLPEDNRRQKQLFGSDRYDMFSAMVKNGLHHQYMRNMLHLNNGDGTFSEIGQLAGIANTDWSWAALLADYDNDGIQDLFVSNGFKRDLTDNDFAKFRAHEEIEAARRQGKQKSFLEVISRFTENKLPNYIFRGNDDLTFTRKSNEWGLAAPTLTNGVAYADLDNDGDLDLVMNNINEQAGIYRNNAEALSGNHYLRVQLEGSGRNTFALGSRVTLFFNNRKLVRELLPVRGFQSSVDPVLHFGLGRHTSVDSIQVRWPTGETSSLHQIRADQKLTIKQHIQPKRAGSGPASAPTFFEVQKHAVDFVHRENSFADFHIQALLPRMYSTQGPALACADVNGDQLPDLYAGGARGQAGALLLQTPKGSYIATLQPVFEADQEHEDTGALFFDMDGDHDQDLYVVSGGYEYAAADTLLHDRLYENDGHGQFRKRKLLPMASSGSCVRPADIDNDGDTDLFVGGRIVPGRYPEKPESVILLNDGKGNFTSGNHNLPDALKHMGMVTDAVWVDLNKDRQPDLVVAGEWMPLRVLINDKGKLSDRSGDFIKERTEGLWNCIIAADFDLDGDQDLVIGNQGLNTQMKVSPDHPASVVYADFDHNGSVDPLLDYFIQDRNYPYATRDELTEQLPSFKKRFTSYSAYSVATLAEVLTESELSAAERCVAYRLETCYLQNDAGSFTIRPMPVPLQFAPVFALAVMDVNKDGKPDIVSGGNLTATRARTGKLTGNMGFVFLGNGHGNFSFVSPVNTGISAPGDVRHILVSGDALIMGINNAGVQVYKRR